MSARPPPLYVAVVVAVVLAATVAPSLGPTAAAAIATPSASAAAPSASFGERVVHEQRGDIANITVKTSQAATVNLGSPNQGFWLQVRVGGGTTRLRLNTYKAGESDSYDVSEMVWASKGSIKSRELKTEPIDAPLDLARYEINVTIAGNEHALGTLAVEERATNGISARIAPRAVNPKKVSSEADLQKQTVPPWDDSLAYDDLLFLHVDASGVRGVLSKGLLDGTSEVMQVDFEQSNPPMNGEGNAFSGASVERLFTTGDTEGFYLAVDTGKHGIEPGDEYEVTFTVPAESPLADERQSVSKQFRVAERRVTIDRKGPGDFVVVEGKTAITGKTTLTPGSTINLSARDTGTEPFVIPKTATVRDDRTFAVTMDFSGLDSGREFEIRLPDQGQTVPGVVEGITTTTPETTTTTRTTTTRTTTTATPTTTPPPTTTGPDGEGERNETNTTTTNTTKTTAEGLTQAAIEGTDRPLTQQAKQNGSDGSGGSGPVPGFGAVTGAVALLAAALLSMRRR